MKLGQFTMLAALALSVGAVQAGQDMKLRFMKECRGHMSEQDCEYVWSPNWLQVVKTQQWPKRKKLFVDRLPQSSVPSGVVCSPH